MGSIAGHQASDPAEASGLLVEPTFVADVNVGRLAKWLRIMGYDTLMPDDTDDGELIRVALREGRVILTRDVGIVKRRVVRLGQLKAILIADDHLAGQIKQLGHDLRLEGPRRFSRCIRCNELLQRISREEAAPQVPEFVLGTQQEFMACPSCCRVYWKGTHWANMTRELAKLEEEERG